MVDSATVGGVLDAKEAPPPAGAAVAAGAGASFSAAGSGRVPPESEPPGAGAASVRWQQTGMPSAALREVRRGAEQGLLILPLLERCTEGMLQNEAHFHLTQAHRPLWELFPTTFQSTASPHGGRGSAVGGGGAASGAPPSPDSPSAAGQPRGRGAATTSTATAPSPPPANRTTYAFEKRAADAGEVRCATSATTRQRRSVPGPQPWLPPVPCTRRLAKSSL